MPKIKCNCGNKLPVTCPKCSVLKMVIMLKNGFEHLKVSSTGTTNTFNPAWYSPIKYNHQSMTLIKNKMIEAFRKQSKYTNAANCLLFYTNNNGQTTFYEKVAL